VTNSITNGPSDDVTDIQSWAWLLAKANYTQSREDQIALFEEAKRQGYIYDYEEHEDGTFTLAPVQELTKIEVHIKLDNVEE